MFDDNDTRADQFHGPLIDQAVADILAHARSAHRVRAIVARAVHEARTRGAAELASDLIGVPGMAARLGVGEATVKRLAAARYGQLDQLGARLGPAVRDPWVFRAVDVAAFRAILAATTPRRPRKGQA